jgi:hypothetical protein
MTRSAIHDPQTFVVTSPARLRPFSSTTGSSGSILIAGSEAVFIVSGSPGFGDERHHFLCRAQHFMQAERHPVWRGRNRQLASNGRGSRLSPPRTDRIWISSNLKIARIASQSEVSATGGVNHQCESLAGSLSAMFRPPHSPPLRRPS